MKTLILLFSALGIAHATTGDEAVHLRTGVILDPASQSLIAMLPEGGVAAFDVNTGTTKWSSPETDKPLLVRSGQLLSQQQVNKKGVLSLVYQSLSDGKIHNKILLELPNDVMANVVNTTGTDFKIAANRASNKQQLEWSFKGKKVTGAAPDSEDLLNKNAFRQQQTSAVQQGVIELDFDSRLANPSNENVVKNSIKKSIESRVLPNKTGRQFLSQDGQHVLVSQRIPSNKTIEYQWHIHSVDGELLGSLKKDISYAPFVVSGQLMVFIAPETVRVENNTFTNQAPLLTAIDLQKKETVWENPIRSTKYFGQVPH